MQVSLIGGMSTPLIKTSPLHSHNEWEIVLNVEGEGTTIIGETEYSFYPGTIICLPPHVPHSKTSPNTFRDMFIRSSDFIRPTKDEIPIFTDDEEKSFETLLSIALRAFHKKDANYISVVNSLYEAMQQMLLSWSGLKPKNESIELFKNELINNFMNPEYEISHAMKKTAYCNDHFRRCFKKDTGTTPISYLINLRIEYAKKLLLQKSSMKMSISEISYLSGFYDPHYFSRLFRNKVGMTPQNYILAQKICESE